MITIIRHLMAVSRNQANNHPTQRFNIGADDVQEKTRCDGRFPNSNLKHAVVQKQKFYTHKGYGMKIKKKRTLSKGLTLCCLRRYTLTSWQMFLWVTHYPAGRRIMSLLRSTEGSKQRDICGEHYSHFLPYFKENHALFKVLI